ncbi:MAG: hypothetical protein HYV07_08905 [Deltaproteobacteria bacterium]|nr:hypothetical protein [Deltaproteobacteria bacterium]
MSRHSELILDVLAKLTYSDEYLQAPGLVDDSLGDVYRYVELLASRFNRWRPGERQAIHDRLSIESLNADLVGPGGADEGERVGASLCRSAPTPG